MDDFNTENLKVQYWNTYHKIIEEIDNEISRLCKITKIGVICGMGSFSFDTGIYDYDRGRLYPEDMGRFNEYGYLEEYLEDNLEGITEEKKIKIIKKLRFISSEWKQFLNKMDKLQNDLNLPYLLSNCSDCTIYKEDIL